MRVENIKVSGWRNLARVSLSVPPEARFVCLVGENGTGKSSILELLTWAAHNLGLSPQAQFRRPPPQVPDGRAHEIEITVVPEREAQLRLALVSQHGLSADVVQRWDGRMTFWSRSWSGATPPELPPASSTTTNAEGGTAIAVIAGPQDSDRLHFGGTCVAVLRQIPELLHLYIDAERVFPPAEVQDHEVLALSRQDVTVPDWLKNQAAQLTQNLYLEWMRALLGAQQRQQAEFFQLALDARGTGQPVQRPNDPLDAYRAGLAQVLPHLRLVRLDHERRRLIFDSAGTEVAYEELSGGERELAFLVGQLDRFGMRDGLFLLDEPELHLNPELLRGWLDYLRGTVATGQAWVATHALEAAEIAGPAATFVIERDDDRLVRRVSPLADRPALSTLAAAIGTPAFSVARSRFVLIEGTRQRRERERFALVLDTGVADRFIEADGCEQVLARLEALRALASEEEQLRVAGIVDRDFRNDEERERLHVQYGVHVLAVHEIENLFLQPELVARLLADAGRDPSEMLSVLQRCSDPDAGRWAFEKAKTEESWREDARDAVRVARKLTWSDVSADIDGAARQVAERVLDVSAADRTRRRVAVAQRLNEYAVTRTSAPALAGTCFGKEALARLAGELGFRDASAIESRAAVLWRSNDVSRPSAAREIRVYLDAIPVLA